MEISWTDGADYTAGDAKFAIVAARFNGEIVERMLKACVKTLSDNGVAQDSIETVHVPGAFEIPLVAKRLAATGRYAAVITLGCVIRGDTPHFDYVAGECARGVTQGSLDTNVPIVFGVLTTDTLEQANVRSQVDGDNKGVDCALCALEMNNVLAKIK